MKNRILLRLLAALLLLGVMLSAVSCASHEDTLVPEGMQSATAYGATYRLYVPTTWSLKILQGISGAYYNVSEQSAVSVAEYPIDKSGGDMPAPPVGNKSLTDYFFEENLLEGRLFKFEDTVASNEIIISKTLADKLNFKLDDKVRTYFWQDNNYRARAFKVVGIYSTDLTEFDDAFIIGDIRTVQKLNNWADNQVGGYEILVDNFDNLPYLASQIYDMLDYDLTLTTVVESQPDLFSWLELLNTNIVLILGVMALVCMVSIISALLIMIFEKTSMIGLLKTLGATNRSIRRIFIYKSISIIGVGLLIGNIVAFAFVVLQSKFQFISLNKESYSMSAVPVDLNGWTYLLVSIGTMAACLLALLVPTGFISKVRPAKTIRVE